MSNYAVELSGDAQDQISEIYGYIRDNLSNPSAAKTFLDDTEEAISSLEQFPYAHMERPGSELIGGSKKASVFLPCQLLSVLCGQRGDQDGESYTGDLFAQGS